MEKQTKEMQKKVKVKGIETMPKEDLNKVLKIKRQADIQALQQGEKSSLVREFLEKLLLTKYLKNGQKSNVITLDIELKLSSAIFQQLQYSFIVEKLEMWLDKTSDINYLKISATLQADKRLTNTCEKYGLQLAVTDNRHEGLSLEEEQEIRIANEILTEYGLL